MKETSALEVSSVMHQGETAELMTEQDSEVFWQLCIVIDVTEFVLRRHSRSA